MHVADALVSTPVATTAGAVALILTVVASQRVSKIRRNDIVPLMGVMGAFIFAAQMINFSIPGTGSSGHIIGGVLLAALMGPWAAFLTLTSVLIIQCLIFADGGLMALGCNIINMAAVSCLIAYPLFYRPIADNKSSVGRIMGASILACVLGLEIGAFLVTVETLLSGVTALPFGKFLLFMLPIHLAIGLCEGVATGTVLSFIARYRRDLLYDPHLPTGRARQGGITPSTKRVLWGIFIVALLLGGVFSWIASEYPDGLEWSILGITGDTELAPAQEPATALLAGYDNVFSGIVGALIMITVVWGLCRLIFIRRGKKS